MSSDDQGNDGDESSRQLTGFEKLPAFRTWLEELLAVDATKEPTPQERQAERETLLRLTSILNEYQEQAFLLDPHLEEIVIPVADALRNFASWSIARSQASDDIPLTRVNNLALLLHGYVANRGYKTIVNFFPHSVVDLPIALSFMTNVLGKVDGVTEYWALRFATLLWLALVCILPFDLSQFDHADPTNARPHGTEAKTTMRALRDVAQEQLRKAGVERDGASYVLSRLFTRKDTHNLLQDFIQWCRTSIKDESHTFLCIGCLQVLAEFVKSAPLEILETHSTSIHGLIIYISGYSELYHNTIIRKYHVKLISRLSLRSLPAKQHNPAEVEDIDVPDNVETALQELFESLQDKDTMVRWSSAKGIARIAERLSQSFADQVLENIFSFFTMHGSLDDDGVVQGLPPSAEQPWHGATLACAELVRRNLVRNTRLEELLQWMAQALYFDVRRGANSVGISVRDAAAFVLWFLARVPDGASLKVHAIPLAQKLVNAALFDREISIRRAASAAFQEHVGRTSLFPHGIDVIGKMDFFAVSNRRNSFVVAAPQVATFPEYRDAMIGHIFSTTLRHWDENMRQLGSLSLRKIAESDLSRLLPDMVARCKPLVQSMDLIDVHGALGALSELSAAVSSSDQRDELEAYRKQIFAYISIIPQSMLFSSRNPLVLEATCVLLSSTLSTHDLSSVETEDSWRLIIEAGLKHRDTRVQQAAALATLRLSELEDCTALMVANRRGSSYAQQGLARMLGYLDFTRWPHNLKGVYSCLLQAVNTSTLNAFSDVEARKIAYESLARIVKNIAPCLPDYLTPEEMKSIFDAFFAGMQDYSVNERGDVGSWVRLACIRGICSIMQDFIKRSHSSPFPEFSAYLPVETFTACVGCILKQGVERLDNVRQQAGEAFSILLSSEPPNIEHGEKWRIRDRDSLSILFCSTQHSDPSLPDALLQLFPIKDGNNSAHWADGAWLFPKAVKFLDYEEYRLPVLHGLLASVASKTGSTERTASSALIDYARSLPTSKTPNAPYDLQTLASDILSDAKKSPSSNAIVIPILQTFNTLLDAGTLTRLSEDASGIVVLKELMRLASRSVEKMKSAQRIVESMKIIINLIAFDILRRESVSNLGKFLQHGFPKIRADTAEALYLMLQTKEVDYDDRLEECLLETDWANENLTDLEPKISLIIESLPS